MENIKKVMVATGFSEHAPGLLGYATKLAEAFHAELIVASIISSRDVESIGKIVSLGYKVDGEQYVEGVKNERKKILEEIIKDSAVPVEKIRIFFIVGNPADELLKLSVEEKADMIVMGIKEHTNIEHFFVGSVADKIFRRSPVTVVSFRDEKSAERLRKRSHLRWPI